MIKIIKTIVIFIILSTLRISVVKAETFYEDNWVSGVYVNLVDKDFSKPQQVRFIKRRSDNKAVYCLTPRETIYETENYNNYNAGDLDVLNMSVEKFLRLSEIAYFGYGYPNHTSDEWYAITQFMLWKEMEPNMDIFFTDKFKGNRIDRFQNEINEIESLIENFKKMPNFGKLNLLPNKKYEIEDKNNVLNTYSVFYTDGLDIKKNNNKIVIKANKTGEYNFELYKAPTLYSDTSYIYKANRGQDLLVSGSISSIYAAYNVKVTKGKLVINKKDSETNNNLSGAKYNLYKGEKLITTLITDINGNASYDKLIYGNYTLKEIEAPIGYKKDNEIHNVEIDKETTNLDLTNTKIKSTVNITKILEDTNMFEEGIKFKIYDEDDNLIDEIITDNNGNVSIKLEYGKYKFVQQNTVLGYKKHEDFYVDIKDEDTKNIVLKNERIIANLKILKKDFNSKKIITSSITKFKIYDLINKEYLLNNNSEIFKTKAGEINLVIKGGKYRLEEIESPNGYIKGDDIEFIIDDNIEDQYYILNYYNKKEEKISFKKNLEKENKIKSIQKEIVIDPINKNIEEPEITTIYPKTSNTDIIINSIICYILFLGLLFIIMELKNEK